MKYQVQYESIYLEYSEWVNPQKSEVFNSDKTQLSESITLRLLVIFSLSQDTQIPA